MKIDFEYIQTITTGHNPSGFHSPDNVFQLFYTDDNGKMHGLYADTENGDFKDKEFIGDTIVVPDTNVEHLKIAYLPRLNVWATWKNKNKHRMAVFVLKQETNKYVTSGEISFSQDNPISPLRLTLENPRGIISNEDGSDISNLAPGTRINVFFSIGDSSRVHMGVYYMDNIKMTVGDKDVSIDGRNITGKLLKEQTFDEKNTFNDSFTNIFKRILNQARIPTYYVETTGETVNVEFPPDMNLYEGIEELLKLLPNWQMREEIPGIVVIGRPRFPNFSKNGVYTFKRDTDCFSRSISRDDMETYSRICVHTQDFTRKLYRDVKFIEGWNLPIKKTLYVQVPDGTSLNRIESYANELSERLANVGVVETFVGPFRPQLQPGDQANIIEVGKVSKMIGIITEVRHRFGTDGFYTEFTVDSGGVIRQPRIKDLIEKIGQQTGRITIS